jgi:hypothetical protein
METMDPAEIFQSERVDGLRVVLFKDDDPAGMDEDHGMPYTVRLWTGRSGDCTAEAGEHWAGNLDPEDIAILRAEHRDDELVASELCSVFGALDVECIQPGQGGDRWYLIATPQFVAEAMGITGDPKDFTPEQRALIRTALTQAAETVTDHVEGNIYRWELQRQIKGLTVYYNGDEENVDTWQTDESCGSLVGWKWAQEDALDQLADAELSAPVTFPQQRPHAIARRGVWLWTTVAAPALSGDDIAKYIHIRRTENAEEFGWSVDLRLGWGIDTTTERRFDEDTAWAALVACASGALRIDSAVALECRDLVQADWRSGATPMSKPLSKRAAETVVQVALIGAAPYPDVH